MATIKQTSAYTRTGDIRNFRIHNNLGCVRRLDKANSVRSVLAMEEDEAVHVVTKLAMSGSFRYYKQGHPSYKLLTCRQTYIYQQTRLAVQLLRVCSRESMRSDLQVKVFECT
jgi:hypothetical protein